MCAMLLADLGATVLRVARPAPGDLGSGQDPRHNLLNRSRPAVTIDLKHPAGRDLVLRPAGRADVLLEGFRPGVMERLGLGPADCAPLNPRLIYSRVTGWGQDGPLAQAAAHDLNYIAISGALHAIGRQWQLPSPPLTLVGDSAGGAMNLAIGVLAALVERAARGWPGGGCGRRRRRGRPYHDVPRHARPGAALALPWHFRFWCVEFSAALRTSCWRSGRFEQSFDDGAADLRQARPRWWR